MAEDIKELEITPEEIEEEKEIIERNGFIDQLEVRNRKVFAKAYPTKKTTTTGNVEKGLYNVLEKVEAEHTMWYKIGDRMWVNEADGGLMFFPKIEKPEVVKPTERKISLDQIYLTKSLPVYFAPDGLAFGEAEEGYYSILEINDSWYKIADNQWVLFNEDDAKIAVREPLKDLDVIAREYLDGKWGKRSEAYNALTEIGYNFIEIQTYANQILANEKIAKSKAIAEEVIAGKWGEGFERKIALEKAGYDFSVVIAEVNNILNENDENSIKVGDHVKIVKPVGFTGKPLSPKGKKFEVVSLYLNKAVIVNKKESYEINIENLKKVK